MVKVLNVEKLIDTQSQKHKERLLSQYTRLLDSSPSFATYYSIDGINSSAEIGTRDLMQYVGEDSPIKFKKIDKMPIFSVNAITAEISYDETAGTYTEFSDEALVLNSVLRPTPGDHFILEEFNTEIIFAVTDVKIRAIRGEDHYVIEYSVVPSSRMLNIGKQVIENYKCIFRNIGTENTVLIKTEDYKILQDYMEAYRDIHARYIDDNYDPTYGYLKTPDYLTDTVGYGTCKYLIRFLMDNRVIYFDEILESIFAFETVLRFESRHNKLYHQSFPLLKVLKQKLPQGSAYVTYRPLPVSLFKDIADEKITQSVEFKYVGVGEDFTPAYDQVLLYDEAFTAMVISKDYTTATPLQKVVLKFINGEDITVDEFEETLDDYEVSDHFRFFFMPVALLALKVLIQSIQTTGNR